MSLPKWVYKWKSTDSHEQMLIEALSVVWEALEDTFKMIDEGKLVRDISRDGDSDYAIRSMEFVTRLAKNYKALRRISEMGK